MIFKTMNTNMHKHKDRLCRCGVIGRDVLHTVETQFTQRFHCIKQCDLKCTYALKLNEQSHVYSISCQSYGHWSEAECLGHCQTVG